MILDCCVLECSGAVLTEPILQFQSVRGLCPLEILLIG